jgi:hypothetical protein
MNVGQAVYVEGFDEPRIIAQIHNNGEVTVNDLNQAAMTVDKEDIQEV